jgi:hypothetical protein
VGDALVRRLGLNDTWSATAERRRDGGADVDPNTTIIGDVENAFGQVQTDLQQIGMA